MYTLTDTLIPSVRHDGWTPQRKRLFFETLGAGHTVAWACARVGLSRQAAYTARRRDPAFAQAWRLALETARRAAVEAFLEGLPDNLRRALSDSSTPCELRGGRSFPQDTVRFVKPM